MATRPHQQPARSCGIDSRCCARFGTSRRACLAAVACGADGLIVEVHSHPENALSDKDQALTPRQFGALMKRLHPLHQFVSGLL